MASGSQSMTTYYAKRIVGDASAAQANSALLQTGANVVADTWILNRTNRVNTYGIKYVYDDTDGHDTIELYGGAATASAWVQLDTGDITAHKFIGALEGNADTATKLSNTPNNTTTFLRGDNTWSNTLTGTLLLPAGLKTGSRVNGSGAGIEIGDDGGIEIYHSTTLFIDFHYQASTADYSIRLICNSATELKCSTSFTAAGHIYANGGYLKSTANGNTITIGSQNTGYCHIENSANRPFYFNKVIQSDGGFTIYNTGANWRNGYLQVNKSDGGDCYIEICRAANADWRILNSGGNLYFQSNWTSAKGSYFNVLQLDYNTGRAHFKEYVYASYFNSSCEVETPTDGSYWLFANSDGFFRKSSRANIAAKIDLEHKWVRIGGDTMTGDLLFSNSGTTTRQVRGIVGDNDYWRIAGGATASNAGWMEIATADDGNEPVYVRQYTGAYTTIKRTLTLLDASGNSSFPGTVTATKFSGPLTGNVTGNCSGSSGSCTGNAATATKLQTKRSLWGNDFDGSAAISGHIKLAASKHIYMTYNSTEYAVLYTHNNGNVSLRACGGGLYIGYQDTTLINWLNGKMTLDSSGNLAATKFTGAVVGNVTGNCSGSSGSCTGNAATATRINGTLTAATSNVNRNIWISDSGASGIPRYASNFYFNPSTSVLCLPAGGRVTKASDNLYIGDSGNSGWVLTQDICSHSGAGDTYWSARVGGVGHFKQLYGAVWNDYAEMRNVPEAQVNINRICDDKGEIERDYPNAGRCVAEIGNGSMALTTKRLQKGCKIISDTFGFCIGETEDSKTPIAVTGRVLAYPYESITELKQHIGDCVCSGPNGTISIMTDEEKVKYPECIVGTISEIPTYSTWKCGNAITTPIKVNDRIWIYVR